MQTPFQRAILTVIAMLVYVTSVKPLVADDVRPTHRFIAFGQKTYLVPHLLDFAVMNYAADGKVLSKLDTTVPGDSERKIHSWPFTAIRHGEGHTLVCCTNGNRVVDFDADGKMVWQLTNDDLPGPWLQDPCGGQVLPNGNIVITSYAGGRKDPKAPKLFEVNRDKQVVWTHSDGRKVGIHHFQILDTNGESLASAPLK